jgi:hypothetical protein
MTKPKNGISVLVYSHVQGRRTLERVFASTDRLAALEQAIGCAPERVRPELRRGMAPVLEGAKRSGDNSAFVCRVDADDGADRGWSVAAWETEIS